MEKFGQATCEAEQLIDLETGETLGYWSRGHHTGEELLRAAQWYSGDEISFDPTKVRQTYYRQIPIMPGEEYDHGGVGSFRLMESKQGKGAFPVTVYEGEVSG
jgi:hypothetical protein